jgi:hypothetical protein
MAAVDGKCVNFRGRLTLIVVVVGWTLVYDDDSSVRGSASLDSVRDQVP